MFIRGPIILSELFFELAPTGEFEAALVFPAREFWIVDPKSRTVTVYSSASGMHVYSDGAAIPLDLMAGSLEVSQIFAGCE